MQGSFALYKGDGQKRAATDSSSLLTDVSCACDDPAGYLPEQGLVAAVNVALHLGVPLLITGEPGTGKTQLAYSVAYELDLPLHVFFTKATSTYNDLFYRYDALRHFQDVQLKSDKSIERYIYYGPLGKAIQLAMDRNSTFCPPPLRSVEPTRSVILIDEIDKAPRDLPNDILNEIENMAFVVPECDITFEARKELRPLVIFTSNLEKDLPAPFRRRCVFYHISFPSDAQLLAVVKKRLGIDTEAFVRSALTYFKVVRSLNLEKNPATAELLAWIQLLERCKITTLDNVGALDREQRDALVASHSVLAKSIDDLQRLRGDPRLS